MNRDEIKDKLQKIFRDVFGQDDLIISDSSNTENIEEWDSLTHITILEAVQDEFEVNFSLDEMIEMDDVERIINAIVAKKL